MLCYFFIPNQLFLLYLFTSSIMYFPYFSYSNCCTTFFGKNEPGQLYHDLCFLCHLLHPFVFYVFLWFLCAHYKVTPPNMKISYGCSQSFSICHVLKRRHGGITTACHNEVSDKLLYLEKRALYPKYVCGETLIHQGRIRSEEGLYQGRVWLYTRGGVLIRGLWESNTEATIDVRLGDPRKI